MTGAFPQNGLSREQIVRELDEAASGDLDYMGRLASGTVYDPGGEVLEVAKEATLRFFSSNALYSSTFPAVARFEREIVGAVSDLFNGPEATGSVTSGGTESILMGVKSARDRARELRPHIDRPQMVVPASAHPAFWKAAHYFGIELIKTPLTPDHLVDLDAYLGAVTDDTILMVGSAPSLTLGMVDPIPEMSAVAHERDINFHVDSCVGGFFLPFAERLGEEFPVFDFRNPGVTTISADLHKFGYAAKGASVIISRDHDIYRHQTFSFGAPERNPDWFVTPSMTGTRPGHAIAAAWAVLNHLGRDGYLRVVGETLQHIRRFQSGIDAIDGLRVLGRPAMTVFAYTSDELDVFAIAKGLMERGWMVSRDTWPRPTIRFMQSLGHAPRFDPYLADLAEVVEDVRAGRMTATNGRADYN
jgi:sphinganine-1-phosphate aldolase